MKPMKPQIGIILLRAEWFDGVVALPELVTGVHQDAAELKESLPDEIALAEIWVVNSMASLADCAEHLRTTKLDLVVLAFQVWAEDFYLSPLIDAIGKQPLAVWCYQPSSQPPRPAKFVEVLRYSGPVGTLEGLGTLRNLKTPFLFLAGAPDSASTKADLIAASHAGQAVQALRNARFGLLPCRNDQMQSTFVDEFRLRAELGPTVEYLSVATLMEASENVSDIELADFLKKLQTENPIRDVRPETLEQAARVTLGLAHLTIEHKLDVLSLNDIAPELHTALGLRPCFYPPLLMESGALWGLEGDLGAATALLVLYQLTGSPIFFTEFWFWDEIENLIVGGHAGVEDSRVARPGESFITHDFEYSQSDRTEGAQLQFACRPGRVTLLQVRCTPTGWQAICFAGEVVDMPAWIEGYPHAVIRPDVPVLEFFRQAAEVGTTQHWGMAYGDAISSIRAWCSLAQIPLKIIDHAG